MRKGADRGENLVLLMPETFDVRCSLHRYRTALERFQRALRLLPRRAHPHVQPEYATDARPEDAEVRAAAAERADSDSASDRSAQEEEVVVAAALWEMSAQVHLELDECADAVRCAEEAARAAPRWWLSHQTLGRALLNLGDARLVSERLTSLFFGHMHTLDFHSLIVVVEWSSQFRAPVLYCRQCASSQWLCTFSRATAVSGATTSGGPRRWCASSNASRAPSRKPLRRARRRRCSRRRRRPQRQRTSQSSATATRRAADECFYS